MFDKEKLLSLYPGYTTVYGPYLRKDGRKHVILNNNSVPIGDKNKLKTISFPKALVEIREERRLEDNETVDHHDRNHTNDTLGNLKILDRSKHTSLDRSRVKIDPVKCPECGNVFTPSVNQRSNKTQAGPFCSRTCAGKYGSRVQAGGEKLTRTTVVMFRYRVDK